jgi:phosphoribosylanthranilate isomerase
MKIKVCGLTRLEDAELALSLGAWALGFIFYEKSPRGIDPATVSRILGSLKVRDAKLRRVGVFVNAKIEAISTIAAVSDINTIQLHGDESPEFCMEFKSRFPQYGLLKALRLKGPEELPLIQDYILSCDAVVLDTYVPGGAPGGTGVTGDWILAAEAARKARVILSGGLNPANAGAAAATPGIFGLDVSSGLEDRPGIKSADRMRDFFANAGAAP